MGQADESPLQDVHVIIPGTCELSGYMQRRIKVVGGIKADLEMERVCCIIRLEHGIPGALTYERGRQRSSE